jgi:hypothetical protein
VPIWKIRGKNARRTRFFPQAELPRRSRTANQMDNGEANVVGKVVRPEKVELLSFLVSGAEGGLHWAELRAAAEVDGSRP